MTEGTTSGSDRPTWRSALAGAAARLAAAGVAGAQAEARRLVERASGLDGPELVLAVDEPVSRRAAAHLDDMLERRQRGEPLQYVVGCWGFRSLDLYVDRRVLIPRPETEQVTEAAIAELRRVGADERAVTAVDLGTGSGAIALSVATEVVRATVWATDRSADALAVARANCAGLGRPGARVRLAQGDWYAALPQELSGRVDLIVSNPPYVAAGDELPEEVAAWEPAGALVAGPEGTEAITEIVTGAPGWLAPRGSLVVELAPHQAPAVTALARDAGFAEVSVRPDLAGRLRALVARR